MNTDEYGRSFQHYENYYDASKEASNPPQFHYAIARFFYEGIEPEFTEHLDQVLWRMIRPSIAKSKRQSERGGGAPIGSRNNPNGRRGKAGASAQENEEVAPENQENHGQKTSEKKSKTSFVPPTIDEVESYAKDRGFLDPRGFAGHFVDYYSQGEKPWHLSNGKPMRDWKRAVITWEPNNKIRKFSQATTDTRRELKGGMDINNAF